MMKFKPRLKHFAYLSLIFTGI